LADFCSEAPDRRAGFAQIFLEDVDEAIAEVQWAKDAGLRGVLLPGDHVLKMTNLYYPHLDPLWAACAELQLPVHRHAAAPTESVYDGGKDSQLVHFVEIQFYTGRAISHLIFSAR
jgi:predicted TIM-barrel fold metal-dependent hydrolase